MIQGLRLVRLFSYKEEKYRVLVWDEGLRLSQYAKQLVERKRETKVGNKQGSLYTPTRVPDFLTKKHASEEGSLIL